MRNDCVLKKCVYVCVSQAANTFFDACVQFCDAILLSYEPLQIHERWLKLSLPFGSSKKPSLCLESLSFSLNIFGEDYVTQRVSTQLFDCSLGLNELYSPCIKINKITLLFIHLST